jgi:hypothetical protein
MPQVTVSGSVNYQAPGGDQVNQALVAVGSYAASSLGTIDVPSGALSGASFSVPLGGVNTPIGCIVINNVGTGINLKTQGNPTGMRVNDGGLFILANSSTPGAVPLSAVEVVLSAAQTRTGTITYLLFGD